MGIRAILFDLDNTLYPASSGVMQQIDRRIGDFVRQRLGLSEAEAQAVREHFYATYGTTLRGLQQRYGFVDTEEYLRFVHNVAIEQLLERNAALDRALGRLAVPKVIFTNSPREHAERVLRAIGVAHHFEQIFDLRYFNFVAKPDPAAYRHVLERLGVAGDEALFFEDTPHNLAPARALGMVTLLICDGSFVCPDADYHVPDILSGLAIAERLIADGQPRPSTARRPARRRCGESGAAQRDARPTPPAPHS
ncbi:pyrimidine 5'-nucleotidase [Kallotenue papyrolyticum]|uniref:pyrimidine 5'-nucleotidase n=1 Tax=Kallotenue papyrolyticum TaxID=1325125 RepID=UPI0004785566|nr:pyrimidine 5'-nucleotidase [Kallotenue papyrolyticum]